MNGSNIKSHHILVIDDSKSCQLLAREALKMLGEVKCVSSIFEAIESIKVKTYDLIVLDISLPDGNGVNFYNEMHANEKTKFTPVIFVSGSDDVPTKVTAFHLGANDYVCKPFNPLELRARCERILRQSDQNEAPIQFIGNLKVNASKLQVDINENGTWTPVDLTVKEFKILNLFAKRPEVVFSRQQIMDQVWGQDFSLTERTVDTHISSLRKKMGPSGNLIKSIRGLGYKFDKAS